MAVRLIIFSIVFILTACANIRQIEPVPPPATATPVEVAPVKEVVKELPKETRRHSAHHSELECVGTSCPKPSTPKTELNIASFNVQFLGNFKDRDNQSLADLMRGYDIVLIQELVAPPYPGQFPDGEPFKPDPEAKVFFDAMRQSGYAYKLSEEDTGTGDQNHLNSAATEWFVAFYNPNRVQVVNDIQGGFLAEDRSNNPDYERVPYAFPFRTVDAKTDFVLISVHLKPDSGTEAKLRRKHELASIENWILSRHAVNQERDYYIVGDMNLHNCNEVSDVLPRGYLSLNSACVQTTTNPNTPYPYDQAMYSLSYSKEVQLDNNFHVINLVDAMRSHWPADSNAAYPGGPPYDHNEFRKHFSDHNPVTFKMVSATDDD